MFDPQISLQENSLESPLADGGASLVEQTRLTEEEKKSDRRAFRREVFCSNTPMSFVNEDYCTLSYEPDICTPRDPSDVLIPLNEASFGKIYETTGGGEDGTRYIFAVQGLRQDELPVDYKPPCTAGVTSRWIPSDCGVVENTISTQTNLIFSKLLSGSVDQNKFLRDITFPLSGESCGNGDENKFDFKVNVNGECWLNVHRSHLQVYDFTSWLARHPGGAMAIKEFAGQSSLVFPDLHGMERWHGWSEDFRTEIGRFGDFVRFSDLPNEVATEDVAVALNAYNAFQNTGPSVVCGSPNEVSNEPSTAGEGFKSSFGRGSEQRKYVWLAIALYGKDQLRQRVAWALSQILVVSGGDTLTEPWVAYYDIFVRHAFGSYRDILKEVSFSPM